MATRKKTTKSVDDNVDTNIDVDANADTNTSTDANVNVKKVDEKTGSVGVRCVIVPLVNPFNKVRIGMTKTMVERDEWLASQIEAGLIVEV